MVKTHILRTAATDGKTISKLALINLSILGEQGVPLQTAPLRNMTDHTILSKIVDQEDPRARLRIETTLLTLHKNESI